MCCDNGFWKFECDKKKSRLEDFVQIRGGSPFGQDGVEFDLLIGEAVLCDLNSPRT